MHGRATCSTSPRVRGEVDLRAELLRSEAKRVRGPFHSLRLAATPPHPDSFAPLRFARNPTSPRTRGEVAQVACALPKRSAGSSRVRGEVDLRAEPLRSEANRVRGRFHSRRLAATPPHPDSIAPLRFARNPTSPRTRGEVAQLAFASPQRAAGRGGASGIRVAKAISGELPRAGRRRFASRALAKRSKSGEGALPQPETRGHAPSPGFHRSAALRSESDLSPHAGRGGASGTRE